MTNEAGFDLDRLAGGYLATQLLGVAAYLGIADLVASEPATADELASATGTDGDALFRVLRALASLGVLTQDADDRFGPTAASERLRPEAPDSLHALCVSYIEPWWWAAAGGLLETVRTGGTAFDAAHGVPLFPYLDEHPTAAARFNANMSAMTTAQTEAVAHADPFPAAGRVVDVGGGHGTLLAAILAAHPTLTGVLFDQAAVVAGASTPPRCEVVGGSFFDEVPAGADVYILKDILHDWDDDRAAAILRTTRAAMSPASRLLVVERVIPSGSTPSTGKLVDVVMLLFTGGRERTRDEYATLFARAGLHLDEVTDLGDTYLLELSPAG